MSTQNLSQEMAQGYDDEAVNDEEVVKEVKAAPFRIAAVILFLLTLGGLFLGMIPMFQSAIFSTSSTALDPLNGTLAYAIWAGTIRSWIPAFVGSTVSFNLFTTNEIVQLIVSFLPYLLFAGLAIALVAMIIGLCSRRAAKPCMWIVFYTIFITFLLFFLFLFVIQSIGAAIPDLSYWQFFVEPTSGIIAIVALIFIVVAHLARKKKVSLVNVLLLLLALGATFGLLYPGAGTAFWLIGMNAGGLVFDTEVIYVISQIVHLALAAVILINLIVLVIRLGTKKGMLVTAILYCLQFALAVTAVILNVINVYNNDWAQLANIACLVILICSLAGALVAILACIFPRKAKEVAEETEDEYDEYEEPVEESAPVAQPATAATPVVINAPAAPAPVVVSAPAPVVNTTPYVGAPVVNYIMPNPGYVAPMYAAPNGQVPAPVVASAPVAPVQEAAPVAPVAAPASEEMSEFEKSMAALAKGETPAEKEATAPAPASFAARRPFTMATPAPVMDSKYTYDPFIYTLTDAEKNEFGDLFIAGQNPAHDMLPTYVIGGDNKEFFSKVFIYLGRFRAQISSPLLAKIYKHVNR